ncbi:hypothetical protein ACFL1X_01980 [Candidatus Hydrogenedentota bacterium]
MSIDEYEDIRRRRPTGRKLLMDASERIPDIIKRAWEIEAQFMLGPDILVAPVFREGAREREGYLPEGSDWPDAWTYAKSRGGEG